MQPGSSKQLEFWRECNRRWNVKTGATRSGKTYMDYFLIPRRLLAGAGKEGLNVILGNTRETIRRNVILPMVSIYGSGRIGNIRTDNSCTMFGQQVFILGADNEAHVNRLRGASIKYCYGDEITTWNQGVFDMLKSRLDKPYSVFDGTCNPEGPQHWFKTFLDSDADIYQQAYCIDDNPYLDPAFVENLKREYSGTVLYDRYIRGLWVAAEGAIYKPFCDHPERFVISGLSDQTINKAIIGVDFGGGTSAHAFCCTGLTNRGSVVILDEYREKKALEPTKLETDFVDFVRRCQMRWLVTDVWCDSAEQTLINGLRSAAARERLGVNIGNAMKRAINDRIRATCLLMGAGRFFINADCAETIDALKSALWDSRHNTEDVRLDDGTTNIDSLDAMEYSFEREIPTLIDGWGQK
ncbi:MAG: terminase family protein [Clostridia bacterium]|nr:terminase family protein [Clostridia bacterium]